MRQVGVFRMTAHILALLLISSSALAAWPEFLSGRTTSSIPEVDGLSIRNHTQECTEAKDTEQGFHDCYFGYYCSNGSCQCRKAPGGIVDCSGGGSFTTKQCFCATFSAAEDAVEVGSCIYNAKCLAVNNASKYGVSNKFYEDFVCRPLNRTGTFCGRCLPSHYPLAYSFNINCIECPTPRWNWVRYIMAAYLPLTLFYLVIVLFKVNIASSHLNSVVLFSQGLSLSPITRAFLLSTWDDHVFLTGIKTVSSLYGIWNLDIFRPFYSDLCLGLDILPTLALDYAIAVYPLLLILVSYLLVVLYDRNYRAVLIITRPFRVLLSLFSDNWEVKSSVIDSFSAFILLSSIKFLTVSFDLLAPTQVYHLYGDRYTVTFRLFYAADIEYFGSEHLPYAILAIATFILFFLLPVFVLALYPFAFFQKFLNLFPVRWHILHTFVDTFQGCYKDGTEPGTRDCRWFSALFFSLRCFCLFVYGVSIFVGSSYFPLCSLFLMLFVLLLVLVQPYKSHFAGQFRSASAFTVLYATFHVTITVANQNLMMTLSLALFLVTIVLVPLFCIVVSVIVWMRSRCKCWSRFCRRRRGYVAVAGRDGDDAAADAYCDRMANPQAYNAAPAGQLVNCSTIDHRQGRPGQ